MRELEIRNATTKMFKIIETKIFIVEYFPFRNELHAPFLPYFDTQHFIWEKNTSKGSKKSF